MEMCKARNHYTVQVHQDYDANFEKHILKKGGKFKMLEEDEDEASHTALG